MPGRVEWTELGGDEAETVLANLIYSEHPTATRVRPSRGDFGLDVLNPSKGWRFLRRPFKAFDAVVILVSAMPMAGVDASLLRLARAARLMHFARHAGHLRVAPWLLGSVLGSGPGDVRPARFGQRPGDRVDV